jgi:hypothetical protein
MALNGRVLLLNQTYEPLGTVSVPRALIMTFKNSVFVEEWDGDRVLRIRATFGLQSSLTRRSETRCTLVPAFQGRDQKPR